MGEGAAEGGCGLDGGEANLTNTGAVVKAEYPLHLVKGDTLVYERHIPVELRHRAVNHRDKTNTRMQTYRAVVNHRDKTNSETTSFHKTNCHS